MIQLVKNSEMLLDYMKGRHWREEEVEGALEIVLCVSWLQEDQIQLMLTFKNMTVLLAVKSDNKICEQSKKQAYSLINGTINVIFNQLLF